MSFELFILALAASSITCSTGDGILKSTDSRCPELVEKAEYYNSQATDDPMGMKMSVEYVDFVYKIIGQRI